MKILWLTNIPSPYRVDFFNELGKYCELTVLFEKSKSDERDNSWNNYKFDNFNGIILKGRSYSVDKAICFDVVKYLKKNKYDYIVVSNLGTITGIIAIEYMKLAGIKYSIETDGGFAKSGKGIKEKYKNHLIKKAQYYFSTSEANDEYYLTYGAKKDRIIRYPFTSLRERDIIPQVLNKEEKDKIKKELGIKEEKIILSIGQFIHRKGYDILLESAKSIDKTVGIYIIGGKATEEYLTLKEKYNLSNVYFVDFKVKKEIAKYYSVADIFVLPTREDIWGLVINEAMAYGLPVITTDKCIAGLELIKDGENGYLVTAEDHEKLLEAINKLINDEQLISKMQVNNLLKIRKYTIEEMAKLHIKVWGE